MNSATETVLDEAAELDEAIEERLDEVRERVEELDVTVRRVVREHPFLTLAGAITAGYLVGRLFSRR